MTVPKLNNKVVPTVCPGCGMDNSCAISMADENQTFACWCQNIEISHEELDRIKVTTKNHACLCKDCLLRILKD